MTQLCKVPVIWKEIKFVSSGGGIQLEIIYDVKAEGGFHPRDKTESDNFFRLIELSINSRKLKSWVKANKDHLERIWNEQIQMNPRFISSLQVNRRLPESINLFGAAQKWYLSNHTPRACQIMTQAEITGEEEKGAKLERICIWTEQRKVDMQALQTHTTNAQKDTYREMLPMQHKKFLHIVCNSWGYFSDRGWNTHLQLQYSWSTLAMRKYSLTLTCEWKLLVLLMYLHRNGNIATRFDFVNI